MPRSNLDPQRILQEVYDEANRALRFTGDYLTEAEGNAAYPAKLNHVFATTTVVNTVTESDLYSFTIPGGSLSAGQRIYLLCGLDNINNSGSTVTIRWRVKLGATTLFDSGAVSMTTNAARRRQRLELDIAIESLTAQRAVSEIINSAVGTGWTLIGTSSSFAGTTTATEDLATDKTLKVTVEHSAADLNIDGRLTLAALTRFP